ncbi:ABC transporter permease [Paraburkholderia sp. MM5482-R1]|uniref:ABC transporter permease n=1 Tax=unclassified Paraburkholderia TaxID=2615204 RepID=UPI003D21EE30
MRRNKISLPTGPWVPLLVVAFLASIAFSLLSASFLTPFNVYVVLSDAALLSVIGFAQLIVLSVGEFSLAVGGIGGFSAVVAGYLLVAKGVPLAPAVLAGLVAGMAGGFINGLLVAKSRVSGFVITLATGGAFTGASLAITQTSPYTNLPHALTVFGTGRIGFVPYLAGATLAVAVALGVLFRWRKLGRTMLAMGGNAEAAQLSGLSKARAMVWAHTLSGLLSAAAGVMAMAKLHEANPLVGADWLIQSFTIPIIGGTSLLGGSVAVWGVIIASLILATINDGLVLIHVNPYWVTLVEGALVFLAVLLGRAQTWDKYREMVAGLIARRTRGLNRT